jgi:hypothetical protein
LIDDQAWLQLGGILWYMLSYNLGINTSLGNVLYINRHNSTVFTSVCIVSY